MNTTRQTAHPPTSKLRRTFSSAAFLLTAGMLALPAGALPTLLAESGGQPISSLVVGDHLSVGLAGAAPNTTYQLRLRDEDGADVELASLTTDAAGNATPQLLWIYTGVVGCDLGSDPDPGSYRFLDFPLAETTLGGRTFVLEAIDSDAVLIATFSLPLVATARELVYFSDEEGCLRYHFKDTENVYLALRHPNRATPSRRFFLTGAGGYPVGSALAEVRLGGAQTWTLPATGNPVVVQAWSAAGTTLGSYAGHFRWEGNSLPVVFRSDARVGIWGPYKPIKGIMITVDGCPDCIRP